MIISLPLTSNAKAGSSTGLPPASLVLTLYLCQSERACTRCSFTSGKVTPRHTAQDRDDDDDDDGVGVGVGGFSGLLGA